MLMAQQTNWIDFLISLSPVFETVLWVGVTLLVLFSLKPQIASLATILVERIRSGDKVTFSYLSLEKQKQLEGLPIVGTSAEEEPILENKEITQTEQLVELPTSNVEWKNFRNSHYHKSHNIMLVHVISPSKKKKQDFDIFIYLKSHNGSYIRDVLKADFFFGKSWGNKVFTETPTGDLVGIKTAAYGPFLCICRVYMKSGESFMLSRYIDFEMGS